MKPWGAYIFDKYFVAMAKNRSEAQIAIRVQVLASGIGAEQVRIDPFPV